MNTYYVTIASNHPHGPGYYEVIAPNRSMARRAAFDQCPEGKWAFIYDSLSEVHPLDRIYLGTLGNLVGEE